MRNNERERIKNCFDAFFLQNLLAGLSAVVMLESVDSAT